MLGEVILDDKINKLSKFKVVSDFIRTSISEDTGPKMTTLKLEIVRASDIEKQLLEKELKN